MKQLKRGLTGVMAALLLVGMTSGVQVKAADTAPQNMTQSTGRIVAGPVALSVPENKVPVYEVGKAKEFVLNVTNTSGNVLTNLTIGPNIEDGEQWPFQTDYQNYQTTVKSLEAGKTEQVKFRLTQKEDVGTARYTLQFDYTADGNVSGSGAFYVNTTAKPAAKAPDTDQKADGNPQEPSGNISPLADAGGYSNGDASYSGGGVSDGKGSVPRVIVTGFSTDPAEVKAGSDFTLTVHLKNTSKTSRVRNMLFDLTAPEEGADEQTTAPAFLPASGSSSVYLDGIKAGGTADISMKMNAKADLLQKPYSVQLSMKYEDADYNAIEATSGLSIPVKQDARFEFSEFEISPESISVGEEGNVMCSLYNLGRIKLYNVKAVFEGSCIEKEEVFVGNVESGTTASIDAMVEGKKATKGPAEVKMTLSYENEEGEATTVEKTFQLEVVEETEDTGDMEAVEEPEKSGFPVWLIGILVVLAAVVTMVVLKKKKQKRMKNEEEELLYELDGPSEDEQQ